MIRQIRSLLYDQGFTIGGARLQLNGEKAKDDGKQTQQLLKQMIGDLRKLSRFSKPNFIKYLPKFRLINIGM